MPTFEGPASGKLLYLGEGMQRILLADSDRATRDLLCAQLRQYEIIYAPTAAGALALARQRRPHLVISEYVLDDMCGLELLSKLQVVVPDLPAIIIGRYNSLWLRARARIAGASGYFPKPLEIDVLQCLIQRLLGPNAQVSSSADQALISQAKSFIEERYAEELTVADVSSHLGMSRFVLYRKFKSVEGVSPCEYLRHVRLMKALELLPSGQSTVTEIAYLLGFGDLARFDKVFKRAMGVTPSAYRRLTLADAVGKHLGPQHR
jgi:AraC-like DNA-binding protein